MLPFFAGNHGNASSPHFRGRQAAAAVASARELIAESVGCIASEVLLTSCATESNNLVILGVMQSVSKRRKIVTSAIEHKSVLGPCEALEARGFDVVRIPVKSDGIVDLEAIRFAVDTKTLLVSVQAANNETGAIQPVSVVADIAHAMGAAFHCDAAQLLGKLPVTVNEIGADFASFSSHKAYGPKGIGFVIVRNHARQVAMTPLMFGGGQENGFRPGTLNVPGVVGTGEACRLCSACVTADMQRIERLRNQLEEGIVEMSPRVRILAREAPRLPGTVSVMFPGIPADLLIARTPTVCMSTGSACTSGSVAPSHVLLALGLSRDEARCVVRFSLGRYNTAGDVQTALHDISLSLNEISTIEESRRNWDSKTSVVTGKEAAS
jgi:cysteine desulfurase